ncbi:MAG TPA: SpoIIE family protein phosphatase [Desulfobacterales bacterium]
MTPTSRRKLAVRLLLTAVALALTHGLIRLAPDRFEVWNARIGDQLQLLEADTGFEPFAVPPRVVHIDANFYYTRSVHAEVIRTLAAAGVQTQIIDSTFTGRVGAAEDLPLIEAVSGAPGVLLGISFGRFGHQLQLQPVKEALSAAESRLLARAAWDVQMHFSPANLIAATQPTVSAPEIAESAAGQGVLNLLPDADGVLRRIPLLVRYRGAVYPSISLLAVCRYLGISAGTVRVEPGCIVLPTPELSRESFPQSEVRIPIDRHGSLIVDFKRLRRPISHYSYIQLSEAAEDAAKLHSLREALAGKIAVVSETVDKRFRLPAVADTTMRSSGEIQVAIIENLLAGQWIRPLSPWMTLAVELVLLGILLVASLQDSSIRLAAVGTAMIGVYAAAAFFWFDQSRLLLPFVGPLLLTAVALALFLAAIGVEKAVRFNRSERARQVAESELEIGRRIQSGFFPTRLPEADGWELQSYFKPARQVAGDFYDAYTIGEDRKLGLVVADVCDKGVGAALFMALFRSLIRVLSGEAQSEIHLNRDRFDGDARKTLASVVDSLNRYIAVTHDREGMFATLFIGILDPQTGVFDYVNGGHEPPVILGTDGLKTLLPPTGPAVGADPDAVFTTARVEIEPGQVLIAYTDGVVDARNKEGKCFSRERLFSLLTASDRSVAGLIRGVHSALEAYVQEAEPYDDITMMVLRRAAPPSP